MSGSKPSLLRPTFSVAGMAFSLFFISMGIWIWLDVKQDRYTDLANSVSILEKYYELTFYQRELSLKSVGERILNIIGDNQEERRLKFARKTLEDHKDLLAFGLADTTGQLMTFTGAEVEEEKPNLTAAEHSRRSFIEAKKSERLVIGEVYYFKEVENWIMPIRVPIRNDSGTLIAVNTSAINYDVLLNNLRSFGFNSQYKIQIINATYLTSQIYYPFNPSNQEEMVFQRADTYDDLDTLSQTSKLISFRAFDKSLDSNVVGVMSKPGSLNHYVVVKVETDILWTQFWGSFKFLLLAYLAIMTSVLFAYKYLRRKGRQFAVDIRVAQDYSASIIDNSPNLVVGISTKGICNFINPATEQITGYSRSEIIGENWWYIMCPDYEPKHLSEFIATIGRGPISNFEIIITTKSKTKKTISWSSMLGVEGAKGGIIGFGGDVTELKLSQEKLEKYAEDLEKIVQERTSELESSNVKLSEGNAQLEQTLTNLRETQTRLIQSEKMASLGILSAGVGHEINNPLNFIKGGVDTLSKYVQRNPGSVKGMEPYFKIINQGVTRVTEIVKSLSHFSRQDAGLSEDCNLHDIIHNCLVMLDNKFKNRIELIKKFSPAPLRVKGNGGKLHQAILNILSNAEQAIENNGVITVTTNVRKNNLEISISDTGMGISKANLNKIRDPFFTTKMPGMGTGLGLSITFDIIEEHGGELIVKSEEGVSSEFIIILPKDGD